MADRYSYFWKPGGYWIPCGTRDEWLSALLAGRFNPKPPPWWIEEQERDEHRSAKTAGVIWNTAYKPSRKFTIWSQASEEDFIRMGYLNG